MHEVVFIVCANEDGFHGDVDYHLRYVVLNGTFYDEPGYEEAKGFLKDHPEVPILLVVSPCRSCTAKGIKGPVEIGYVDRTPDEAD